jgi:putative ABC transport system permease protein
MNWWKALLRKNDAPLDSELRFHIGKLTEDKIIAGLAPEEARRQALLEFGSPELLKEELRDVYRFMPVEHTIANLKSAVRFIRKSPSFAAVVILTLALGIGGNSAVFSAIDAILLKPLPFPESARLMTLHQLNPKLKSAETFVAPIRIEDWNRMNTTFQAITGYYTDDVTDTSGFLPEKETLAWVAPRFLQVWGIAPVLGRDFSSEELTAGGPAAVLISERFWRRRFAGDPNAVGKQLRIGNGSFRIAGVMPASFLFPVSDVDLWSPIPPHSNGFREQRDATWYTAIGRLKPGVTRAQAQANLAVVQAALGKQFPKSDADLSVALEPLKEQTIGGVRRSLWVLFAAVSLVLLIACTNIAALLLARTTDRQQEIAVRYSLGASRTSVMAQLLTETLVLALLGSACGAFLAWGASHFLRALAKSLPRAGEVTLDWRLILYTFGCALVATLLSGLFPAIHATRRSLSSAMAHGGRTQVSAKSPIQWLLVGIQVALAVTLLVGAGLLLRSFQELGRVSAGFDYSHILTMHVSGSWAETANMKTLTSRIDRTLDVLRAMPGVEAAATAGSLPGVPGRQQIQLNIVEQKADQDHKIMAISPFVSASYFAVTRIPLLAGQPCQTMATSRSVMVNRSFADAYLPAGRGIGRHIEFPLGNSAGEIFSGEIRGIVADARDGGLNRAPAPTVYWCVSAPRPDPNYLIRTRLEPMTMADVIRRKMYSLEPGRSVFDISTLEQHLSDSFDENRLRTLLLSLFALMAISLACVGLYGTLSYFVSVRRREVGLRLALGALPGEIIRRFLFHGLGVSLLGCAAGLVLAAASTRVLAGMLYGVGALDVATFAGVTLLVATVAAFASLFPALRAARLEPMQVLRED